MAESTLVKGTDMIDWQLDGRWKSSGREERWEKRREQKREEGKWGRWPGCERGSRMSWYIVWYGVKGGEWVDIQYHYTTTNNHSRYTILLLIDNWQSIHLNLILFFLYLDKFYLYILIDTYIHLDILYIPSTLKYTGNLGSDINIQAEPILALHPAFISTTLFSLLFYTSLILLFPSILLIFYWYSTSIYYSISILIIF